MDGGQVMLTPDETKKELEERRDAYIAELQRITEEEVSVQMELDRLRSLAKKAKDEESALETSWAEIQEAKSPTESVDEVLAMVDEALLASEQESEKKVSSKVQVEKVMQSLYSGNAPLHQDDDENDRVPEKDEEDDSSLTKDRLRRLLAGETEEDECVEDTKIEETEVTRSRLVWLREQLARYKKLEADLLGDQWSADENWISMADGQPWAYLALSLRVEEGYEWSSWSVWTKWSTKLDHLPKELRALSLAKDESRFLTNANATRRIPTDTKTSPEYTSVEPWRPVASWEYAESVDAFALGLGLSDTPGERRALGWPLRTLRRRKWATELARHAIPGLGPLASTVFTIHANTLHQEALCTKLSQEYQRVQAELDALDEAVKLAHSMQAELLFQSKQLQEIQKQIKNTKLLLAASGTNTSKNINNALNPSSPTTVTSSLQQTDTLLINDDDNNDTISVHTSPPLLLHDDESLVAPHVEDSSSSIVSPSLPSSTTSQKNNYKPPPSVIVITTRSNPKHQLQVAPAPTTTKAVQQPPAVLASSVSF